MDFFVDMHNFVLFFVISAPKQGRKEETRREGRIALRNKGEGKGSEGKREVTRKLKERDSKGRGGQCRGEKRENKGEGKRREKERKIKKR